MYDYLIIWESNNGYTCSCCSSTSEWSDIMSFDSEEDFQTWFDAQNKEFICDENRLYECYQLAQEGFRYE